jgi:hypothetical protein
MAKMDDSDIGSPGTVSPPSPRAKQPAENIYDVIDEGLPDLPQESEKVETLSTGSSEGGGLGLLSEIISEIESRNKESIYNSVDRRKKKRKGTGAATKSPGTKSPSKSPSSSPRNTRITVNPGFDIKSGTSSSPKLTKKSIVPPEIPVTVTATVPNVSKDVSPVAVNNKPTCAVNGIPKVNSSPSYVAKINYFSNLSAGKSDKLGSTPPLMKPINSLSQAMITPPPDPEEPIYAPGHLSTIRRSRPSSKTYLNNQEAAVGKGGIYGKPVASPQIPTTTQPKEKEVVPVKPAPVAVPAKGPEEGVKEEKPQIGGYKSFNPYLNRPLTFSTFRPTAAGGKTLESTTDYNSASNKPSTVTSAATCSSLSKPTLVGNGILSPGNIGVSLNLSSPVQLRSPSRLVK